MASGNTTRPAARRGAQVPAAVLPVARVCVDVPLAHLDRPFDYQVPERFADSAVVGCRVRVRFAGQLVDGFVLERVAESGHKGKLAFLEKVVSPEPVLSAD
ncbi:MAG TPA: primosome assembly protein PriA, partial [Pseudonocardiaceae bacterium]